MGFPVTVNPSALNFGGVPPNSTGPDITQYDPTQPNLSAGVLIQSAPADAVVTVSLTGDTVHFVMGSFDVYEWVTRVVDPGELPPRHRGPLPTVRALELVAHSDGSFPLTVKTAQVVSVSAQYVAPAGGGSFAGLLVIQGTSWDPVHVRLSFFVSGVSTTVRTDTPVVLPRGQRVNVPIAVTVAAGPDTGVTFELSNTQLSSGVSMSPVSVHATRSPTLASLPLEVAIDAPLGDNEVAIDQIAMNRTSFLLPVTVVADRPSPWEFVGPKNYGVVLTGGSPLSGRVNAVAYDPRRPGTWYLGAAMGGVWKTTDFGDTWSPMTDGWKFLSVSSIAIDPTDTNTIYVGTGDVPGTAGPNYAMGVMKSIDGGFTWWSAGSKQLGTATISKVLVDPRSPNIVWVTTFPGRVWRSSDRGETWKVVGELPSTWWLGIDRAVSSTSAPDRYYAVGEGLGAELWRTDNGGANWIKLQAPLVPTLTWIWQQRPLVACSLIFSDAVYFFSPTDRKIYASKDAGNNWADITDNWSDWGDQHTFCFACSYTGDPIRNTGQDVLYVGKGRLYRSAPGGGQWQLVEGEVFHDHPLGHADQHAIAINPGDPNSTLVGNDGGVFSMTYIPETGLTNVISLNRSLGITQVYRADYSHDDPPAIIAGAQDVGTAAPLGDLANWKMVGGGDGGSCAINPRNPDTQYLQRNFNDPNQTHLNRTTDGWQSSEDIAHSLMKGEPRSLFAPMVYDPNNPSLLYVATNYLYRWVELDSLQGEWTDPPHLGDRKLSSKSTSYVNAIAVASGDSNRIYTGSSDNEVWMSTDLARTWRRIDAGLQATGGITSISVNPNNPNDVLVASSSGLRHCSDTSLPAASLYVARPMGSVIVWNDVTGRGGPSVLPNYPINTIARDLTNPDRNWYVGTDVGIFFTDDGGLRWYRCTSRRLNVRISDLKVVAETRHIYAATFGRGIWRAKL